MAVPADEDPFTTRYLSPPKGRGPLSRITARLSPTAGRRAGSTAAPRRRGVVAGGHGPHAGPPTYISEVAREAGVELAGYRWSLWARGDYPSQKAVAFLFGPGATAADAVVKITKDARFNARLDNEHAMLVRVEACGGAAAARAPRPLFHGHRGGLAVVGQSSVGGVPFLQASLLTAACPVAADAAGAITALGVATAEPAPTSALADPLDQLLERFGRLFGPPAAAWNFLSRQVEEIRAHDHFPAVLHHGDLGTWNMQVDDEGRVHLLDWEAAEQPGPPLWDLAYFLRSFAVQVSRRRLGVGQRLRALSRHLLEVSPLTSVGSGWVRNYREQIGLDPELVAPLFHTCWMHRAVKEATRLPAGQRGHYAELCLMLAERPESAGLRVLLGSVADR